MTLNFFSDHIFDLINESDLLDVYDIITIENGFRVIVGDGTAFQIQMTRETPPDNVIDLFPDRR